MQAQDEHSADGGELGVIGCINGRASKSRIEGSRLSDREVEQLLSNLEIKSLATRDEQEVAGDAELMNMLPVVEATFAVAGHANAKPEDLKALAKTCAQFCRSCAEACKPHSAHHEECKACEDACLECADACDGVVG